MNEYRRQTYLQHLGIDSYCPRWLLPGAPPPRAIPDRGAPPLPAAVEGPAPVRTAELPPESLLPQTLLRETTPEKPAPPAQEQPAQEQPAQEQPKAAVRPVAPVPRFALTVWRISTELLIIDTREAQLALPTDQLLANIVAALGYRIPQLPKPEVLRWPLVENGVGEQGETEAREMIQAFLDAQLLRQATRHLLVMGVEAARYVLDEPRPFDDVVGSAVELAQLSVTAIVVPSLATMLQHPGQKALTWRAVQPLRQR